MASHVQCIYALYCKSINNHSVKFIDNYFAHIILSDVCVMYFVIKCLYKCKYVCKSGLQTEFWV